MSTVEVKTADLIGPALDYAIAMTQGWTFGPPHKINDWDVWRDSDGNIVGPMPAQAFKPSSSWEHGGPLIDKHAAQVRNYPTESGECVGSGRVAKDGMTYWMAGPTPLIALCRAIVAAHLGDTVQVPEELMP